MLKGSGSTISSNMADSLQPYGIFVRLDGLPKCNIIRRHGSRIVLQFFLQQQGSKHAKIFKDVFQHRRYQQESDGQERREQSLKYPNF